MWWSKPLMTAWQTWALSADGTPRHTASSSLWPVRYQGCAAILKLTHPNSDEHLAPLLLQAWNGCGAVRLLQCAHSAQLLERAIPGTPLAQYPTSDHDTIIALLTQQLATAPLPELPDALSWGRSLLQHPAPASLPAAHWQDAQRLYRQLAKTQQYCYTLHGDLHHDNIVYDQERGWLAIDPKGVRAEREFELGCALRNPLLIRPERTQLLARLASYCATGQYNPARVLGWTFTQAMLAAGWAVEDGTSPSHWVHVAEEARALAVGSMATPSFRFFEQPD